MKKLIIVLMTLNTVAFSAPIIISAHALPTKAASKKEMPALVQKDPYANSAVPTTKGDYDTDDSDIISDQELNSARIYAYTSFAALAATLAIPTALRLTGFSLQKNDAYYIGLAPKILLGVAYCATLAPSAWFTWGNLGNEFTVESERSSALEKIGALVLVLGTLGALPAAVFVAQ